MAASQTPRYVEEKTFFPKACPRKNCGGDVGRFNQYEGDEFKCLLCGREVQPNALR